MGVSLPLLGVPPCMVLRIPPLLIVENLGLFSKGSSFRIYIHEVSRRIHLVWIYSMLAVGYAHGVLVTDVLAHGLVGGWVFSKS